MERVFVTQSVQHFVLSKHIGRGPSKFVSRVHRHNDSFRTLEWCFGGRVLIDLTVIFRQNVVCHWFEPQEMAKLLDIRYLRCDEDQSDNDSKYDPDPIVSELKSLRNLKRSFVVKGISNGSKAKWPSTSNQHRKIQNNRIEKGAK